ncbi:MAG TPA: hypothetical protein VFW40_12800 [Capsulimonadaceae bacterium]|nr:hypothetical protein [Capsulimonadaceae bacterium]
MKVSAGILIICFVSLALASGGCGHGGSTSPSANTPTAGGTVAQHAAATDEWHGFKAPPPALAQKIEQHQAAMGHPMTGSAPAGNGTH